MAINKELLYQSIGEKIKLWRKRKNLSQDALGEKANIKRAYVSQIEKGKKHPPLSVLYHICLALDCDIKDLLPDIADVKNNIFNENIDIIKTNFPKSGKLIEKLMEEKNDF